MGEFSEHQQTVTYCLGLTNAIHHSNMSETPKLQLEVVGAGFGRTGTVSTREAMRILGFWPNYHMAEAAINQSAFTRFASRMAVKFGSTGGPNLPPFNGNHFTLWTEATLAKRQGDDKR